MLGTRVGGAARRGAPPSWMLAIIVALQQLVGASRDTIGPPFHPRPVPPGCTTVGGQCIMPYPGNKWQHPKIHQSPDCCAFDPARAIVFCSSSRTPTASVTLHCGTAVHLGGWHDVAGALTFKGEHHIFQGCPVSQGWSHSFSKVSLHYPHTTPPSSNAHLPPPLLCLDYPADCQHRAVRGIWLHWPLLF